MKTISWIIILVVVVVAMIIGVLVGIGWGQDPGVEYYWTHPTGGSEVHHYRGHQMLISGTDTTSVYIDNIPRGNGQGTWTVSYQFGMTTLFRVAGVDAADRQGQWSLWSDPWIDDGPPTAPGKPSQTLKK